MLDARRYQPTISFPVSNDIIQQKTHKNNNICETKNNLNYHQYHDHVEDESGMCSPPLWNNNSHNNQIKNNYRNLSPESKTQAIERGQRELMEMVKNMPESSYELTLKDLVVEQQNQKVEENNNKKVLKKKNLSNNSGRKVVDKRNGSSIGNIDNGGFYLKMVFPMSLGGSKKHSKKKELLVNSNNNSKVSPRTSISDHGSVVNNKEWWKSSSKKSSVSESGCESDNGSMRRSGSSSTSSCCSSRNNNSRHEMSASSCWPFIRKSEILSQK